MKGLKVKVKLGSIVIFGVVLFFILPVVVDMVGSTLMKMHGEWFGKEKKYYGTAIKEMYTNMPKVIPTTGRDYYDIGKSYYNVIDSKHSYGNGMYTSGNLGNKEMLEKAIVNFEKGVALGEGSKNYLENLSFLINSYIIDGREADGLRLIEDAIKSSEESVGDVGLLNKIAYLVKVGRVEEGIALCEENLDKMDYQVLYLNLLKNYGDYAKYNEAVDKYTKVNDNGDDYYNYVENVALLGNIDIYNSGHYGMYHSSYSSIYYKRESGERSLKGRITKNGVGVPFAEISLVSNSKDDIGRDREVDNRTVYTDKDGYYSVDNLYSKTYSIGILVTAYYLDGAYIIPENGKEENMWSKTVDLSGGSKEDENFEIRDYVSVGKSEDVIYKEGDNLIFDVPKVNGTKKVLKEALYKMPQELRIVLYMFYFDGIKISDISEVLELNQNTVKTRLRRGKEYLKNYCGGMIDG